MDTLRVAPVSQRPGSSLSTRSLSRASQRPTSRLSQRGIARPRLVAFLKTLVVNITGLDAEHDTDEIQEAVDAASKRIDQVKQASVPDLTRIDTHFNGHIRKARIHVQDTLADVLQAKYLELKNNVHERKDLDLDIKPSTLPSHLQFLLLLSSSPNSTTLSHAESILARSDPVPQSPLLTWKKILMEEPFEGQHWQGAYNLPDGSTVEHWEEESSDSDPSSLLDVSDSEEDMISSFPDDQSRPRSRIAVHEQSPLKVKNSTGQEIVEALQKKHYWRPGWTAGVNLRRPFDIGDASTLGPTLDRILMNDTESFAGPELDIFINEIDAVREVLMVLQGRQSCLFELDSGSRNITVLQTRRIAHLTRTSQVSILASFASYASILNHLRYLIRTIQGTTSPSPRNRCRTVEAFTAAIQRQLLEFEEWCAQQEERICLAQHGRCFSDHVISLLRSEKEVGVRLAGTFKILLTIARLVESKKETLSPPSLSALVLNTLLEAVRTQFAIGDSNTAQAVMDVWRESAEPLWANVGRWLKDGIPIRTGLEGDAYKAEPSWDDVEFFIRINPLMDLGSPDFWEGGYTLLPRHDPTPGALDDGSRSEESGIPSFLHDIAEEILAAGKAIGLLRALHMIHLVDDHWLDGWSTFKSLAQALSLRGLDWVLEHLISEILLPPCRLAQSWLRQVLVEECDLWEHLQGFENVYLMTRGDAMSQFGEKIFHRMDTRQPWNDFHFLNTAFRDVTKLGPVSWINPSLVRLSHRGSKDRNISRTVRAIDGLSVEYAVPFPLTYMFGPETNASYSSLFGFLLQIRRSKSVLDRILIRGLSSGVLDYGMPDLKAFYALRSRLSWFVNTFMNFIMTNVIHAGLLEFHGALRKAVSLDEMLICHRLHLERLLGRCLLSSNTSALHRAILSILDLSLHFNECLSAFAGDNSLDVSRRSLVAMRHRHRRRGRGVRMRKPDVIGFTDALPVSDEDSDFESDGDDEAPASAFEPTGGASISFVEESFFTRLDKMSSELDGLLRFVRRGVESLAGGSGDAASTFEVLAFSLEDWDL